MRLRRHIYCSNSAELSNDKHIFYSRQELLNKSTKFIYFTDFLKIIVYKRWPPEKMGTILSVLNRPVDNVGCYRAAKRSLSEVIPESDEESEGLEVCDVDTDPIWIDDVLEDDDDEEEAQAEEEEEEEEEDEVAVPIGTGEKQVIAESVTEIISFNMPDIFINGNSTTQPMRGSTWWRVFMGLVRRSNKFKNSATTATIDPTKVCQQLKAKAKAAAKARPKRLARNTPRGAREREKEKERRTDQAIEKGIETAIEREKELERERERQKEIEKERQKAREREQEKHIDHPRSSSPIFPVHLCDPSSSSNKSKSNKSTKSNKSNSIKTNSSNKKKGRKTIGKNTSKKSIGKHTNSNISDTNSSNISNITNSNFSNITNISNLSNISNIDGSNNSNNTNNSNNSNSSNISNTSITRNNINNTDDEQTTFIKSITKTARQSRKGGARAVTKASQKAKDSRIRKRPKKTMPSCKRQMKQVGKAQLKPKKKQKQK